MGLPAYAMFVEYVCDLCNITEIHTEIIPMHKCPSCDLPFEVVEEMEEPDYE